MTALMTIMFPFFLVLLCNYCLRITRYVTFCLLDDLSILDGLRLSDF
jgi:hypothetical protein